MSDAIKYKEGDKVKVKSSNPNLPPQIWHFFDLKGDVFVLRQPLIGRLETEEQDMQAMLKGDAYSECNFHKSEVLGKV